MTASPHNAFLELFGEDGDMAASATDPTPDHRAIPGPRLPAPDDEGRRMRPVGHPSQSRPRRHTGRGKGPDPTGRRIW